MADEPAGPSSTASSPLLARPTGSAHAALTMSALCAAGGAAAFFSPARSTQSLLAGLLFGSGFGAAAFWIQSGEAERGFRFATLNSALLAGVMGARLWRTRKPMPALPLTLLGAASGVYHGLKWREWS